MGCDIHLVIESRSPGGAWECVSRLPIDEAEYEWEYRNYYGFAVLAGVRNCSKTGPMAVPIAVPRGFPEDATQTARDLSDEDFDGHSHSWVTLKEINDYSQEWGVLPYTVDALAREMCNRAKSPNPEDTRAVFFFDN